MGDYNKKYTFIGEKYFEDINLTLRRIQSISDFGRIKKDCVGGFIQDETNLSMFDNSWVMGESRVFEHAKLEGSSIILGNCKIFQNAKISGSVLMFGNCEIFGKSKITASNSFLSGQIKMFDNAQINGDNVIICGNVTMYHRVRIFGSFFLTGNKEFNGVRTITNKRRKRR